MKIALLGTGLLGRAVAERFQATGHCVTVYNRTKEKAIPLRACGIAVAVNPEEAIAQADVVVLMLADAVAIRAVLLTEFSLAVLQGKTVIQMGTIAQEESVLIQTEIERAGGQYCEAPVLGSVTEAKAGTLLVMVGGTREQFTRWSPLFCSISQAPRLIGPVGKAASLKLALNQLIASEISGFALSLGLVERAGVSVEIFMAILRESALFAPAFEKKLPRMLARNYEQPNFSTRLLLKDVDLILKEASGYELTTSGLEGVRPVLERTIAQGSGDVDYASIYDTINPKT
ncbi:MAG: NAD(P)-dependent oxidoreductase [Nitrospira sp.]|nr:NAD(P)-dependent oxidoreductase [Nitrospira sp.]